MIAAFFPPVDRLLRKEQAVFRRARNTPELVSNIVEQADNQVGCMLRYHEKAFNSVHRGLLWEIIEL